MNHINEILNNKKEVRDILLQEESIHSIKAKSKAEQIVADIVKDIPIDDAYSQDKVLYQKHIKSLESKVLRIINMAWGTLSDGE